MSKRILSLVLAMVMVLGTFGTMVFAETELDPKVQWLIDQELIQGDGSGNYDLDKAIQRSVLARIVALALEDEVAANALQAVPSGFADMTPAHWANGVAAYANAKGYMIGNEKNEFMPNGIVSYDQALVVLTKIALGRDLTAEEKAGSLTWFAPYVAKASELGITEGVSITNVGAPAVKNDILVMLYNVLNNKDYGNYTVLKAIVLENDRVETLRENEVVVEVIKAIQRADFVSASRSDDDLRGDQYNFVLSDKYDVEDLLGKVADFSIDKNGKVVEVKVDETYQYLQGSVTAIEDALKVGTKEYTVVKEERVDSTDDRLYVVYQDNQPVAYRNFADARRYTDENGVGKLEFARVTVKNGKVLFVDGFNFTDVAPIKEVKEDKVVVYNDLRDGGEKNISEPSILIGYNDGKVSRITLDDVKALNVIHTYNAGRSTAAIVRTDAEISGTYEKVSFDRDGKNAKVVVDDKEYSLVDADSKRPVYSYDSEDFYTLSPLNADKELREFKDEKVVMALAVNNSVQYFASDIESGEFMALVSDVLARDVELVRANNDTEEYAVTFRTYLSEGSNNQQTSLGNFGYRDIVFASVDEKNLAVMSRFNDADLTVTKVKPVAGKNVFDINRNYIETDAGSYRILDRTNAFIAVGNTMRGISIEDLVKNLKTVSGLGADLTVKIISDDQFEEVASSSRLYTTGRDDVAHTIVFTINPLAVSYNDGIAKVTRIYSAGRDYQVRLEYADRTSETLDVARPSQAYTAISNKEIKEDDVVELELTKADEPKVVSIESKIAKDAPVFEVVATQSRGEYRILTIEDVNEVKEDYFIYRDADVFGEIDRGSKVSFTEVRKAGELRDIDVLIVRSRTADVNGVHGSTTPSEPGTETGLVTYINSTVDNAADEVVTVTLPADNTDIYKVKIFDETATEIVAGAQSTLTTATYTAGDLVIPNIGTENKSYVVRVYKVVDGVDVQIDSKVVKNVDPVNPIMIGASLTTDSTLATTGEIAAGKLTAKNAKEGATGAATVDFEIATLNANDDFAIVVNTGTPKVTVTLEADSAGNAVTTWQQVVDAVNADTNANALLELEVTDVADANDAAATVTSVTVPVGTDAIDAVIVLTFDETMDNSITTGTKVTIGGKEYTGTTVWSTTTVTDDTATITIPGSEFTTDDELAGKKVTATNLVKDSGNAVDFENSTDVTID